MKKQSKLLNEAEIQVFMGKLTDSDLIYHGKAQKSERAIPS